MQKIKKAKHDAGRGSALSYVWVNALLHGSELRRLLGVSDMYPQVVAVNGRRGVFRAHLGAHEELAVGRFLDDLLSGRDRTVPIGSPLALDVPAAPKNAEDGGHDEL
ncbi:hypothetical protein HK405_008133 [Cladochytrium tenue]|nr:hypothetical protein HK405_008133 [Cladochytrium tenue]